MNAEREKQIIAFKAAVEAEEKQKERTANNLHDEIIPLLTVLSRNIELHQRSLKTGELTNEELENDTKLIEKAINSIRSVALDLIPNVLLNFGLIKALEHYVRETNKGFAAIELENSTSFKDSVFDKRTQVNIYRLCMEVLNNLKKHSYYKYLKIEIANNRNGMFIDIIHDGVSISNEQIREFTRKSNGLGLKSINARLVILNASIDYSTHESLARVLIYIPIRNEKKN